jgi:maltose alpha-D-glucosyltransferase/alpha-amylase
MINWLKDAVFYQIYPQSFYDSDADGIGDIRGIIEKLEYVKETGFNAIWLNPCFESPFMDAGYDISDYYKVAPRYGTNEDLEELFKKAHDMGIRVILDLVPGHTSDRHRWFTESKKAQRNKYSDWYVWTQHTFQVSPPGFNFVSGMQERDGKYMVNFFSHQPALNFGFAKCEQPWQLPTDHPSVKELRKEFKNIMRFWLDKGADGFRVDMAFSLVKNDYDGQGNKALWMEYRKMLDEEYPEAVLVSEWGCPEKSIYSGFHMDFYLQFNKAGFTDLFHDPRDINVNELDSVAKRFFKESGSGSPHRFAEEYAAMHREIYGKGYACMPSGNHDVARLAYKKSPLMVKLCFALLLTMPGVPFVYYGDEIGMTYTDGLVSKEGSYERRTGSRTPMQWDGGENMGFSKAPAEKLYLPIGLGNRVNVEEQAKDPDSVLNTVKRLIKLRRENPELQADGDIEFLYAEEGKSPLVYIRGGKILVAINPRSFEVSASLGRKIEVKEVLFGIGGGAKAEGGRLVLPPLSAAVIRCE